MLGIRLVRNFSGYRPLRSLNKDGLTVLYKREYQPTKTWFYSIPAMGVLANNLLTGFTLVNSGALALTAMIASYWISKTKR